MGALSFVNYMTFHFNITEYQKGNLLVSIDNTEGHHSLKIGDKHLSNPNLKQLLNALNAENIQTPHHVWLENNINKK